MTCPTCRRTDMEDTCGVHDGEPCECCGIVVIYDAERDQDDSPTTTSEEDTDNQA